MISTKWLAYQIKDETNFLMIFRPHMSIWFSTNVKILVFIKWSYPPLRFQLQYVDYWA